MSTAREATPNKGLKVLQGELAAVKEDSPLTLNLVCLPPDPAILFAGFRGRLARGPTLAAPAVVVQTVPTPAPWLVQEHPSAAPALDAAAEADPF